MVVDQLKDLLTSKAIRDRCQTIYTAAEQQRGNHFELHFDKLEACVDYVVGVTDRQYPDANIPFHSRWRHFELDALNLWEYFRDKFLRDASPEVVARSAVELVFVSVLLDAGAGNTWKFVDPVSGVTLVRSEGLAAASIHFFFGTHFHNKDGVPIVNAQALGNIDQSLLSQCFQVGAGNPLLGVDGRVALLQGLAKVLNQDAFYVSGEQPRLGHFFDYLKNKYTGGAMRAGELLHEILCLFGCIWPSGLIRNGICLGDTGQHSLVKTGDATNNLVPFHKLSQWLSYSLLEPLAWGGMRVTDLDDLTGLPEYRNGGLFIDTGVLSLKDMSCADEAHASNSELVTEWRALTVVLLDKAADSIRDRARKTKDELPLASILQGGTWTAGRELAAKRPNSAPPLNLTMDGTVF